MVKMEQVLYCKTCLHAHIYKHAHYEKNKKDKKSESFTLSNASYDQSYSTGWLLNNDPPKK